MYSPDARLIRWRLKLEEHDYVIIYKSGVLNTNTDFLSRISHINYLNYIENTYENFENNSSSFHWVGSIKGDVFEGAQDYSLAYYVLADFDTSHGIALEFSWPFGHVDDLNWQHKGVTKIAQLEHEGKKMLYLIIKEKFF